MDEALEKLRPLRPDGQELVKHLLRNLELDPETVQSSDPLVADENQESLLCTVCDERVAKYMPLNKLIQHFLDVQRWFDNATEAVRTSPDVYYPNRAVQAELPKIVNDHDWTSLDGPLVRQDDEKTRDTVSKLQINFRSEELSDPLCDKKGIGGEDLQKTPKRRKTKKSRSTEDDPAFTPGSSQGKGKNKTTSHSDHPTTLRGCKGGKLRDLMNMPVDIFTEIYSYLGPDDLRRLSLTSKRLRDILMTKEARHIWKIAIAFVPYLAECPTDLNEPQYVCLLYSSDCDMIDCTSRGTKVDWFHRVHFCSACHEVK
ncbi:hypothetical protein M407DRAFT_17964 [Tulasnella calospora MUT 4182]|uniref:F-box domain-containing protein n=1 Tax=Tulasnella calospora MUT 4182 TaxID=1051891 RepID=A0A0C3MHB0_9AGAM|nr:hypothetical protein M407DRAFT_17964 [Tulasnella calospora MUT 4182]